MVFYWKPLLKRKSVSNIHLISLYLGLMDNKIFEIES